MLAIALIDWYQQKVSPRKGFSCARRTLRGGESCSQYAKRVLAESGWIDGLLLLQERFTECRLAAETLDYQSMQPPAPPVDSNPSCPCGAACNPLWRFDSSEWLSGGAGCLLKGALNVAVDAACSACS